MTSQTTGVPFGITKVARTARCLGTKPRVPARIGPGSRLVFRSLRPAIHSWSGAWTVSAGRCRIVGLIEELRIGGVGFRSLCDGAIDTTTASGELVFNIFSSLAQFERRLIQERTRAGLAAARARGRTGGRRSIRSDDPRVLMAKRMHEDKDMKIGDICRTLKISRATFYRYVGLAID